MSFEAFIHFFEAPIIFGLMGEICIIVLVGYYLKYRKNSSLALLFALLYEKMFYFFQDILGKEIQLWVLKYVLTLFCVIFFSNAMSVILSLLSPFFGISDDGVFHLEHVVTVPSADIHFNLAMAIMSMCVIIYIQIKAYGFGGFLYEYFPIFGKGYIEIEQGKMPILLYKISKIGVKIFDILVSLFLGLLDLLEYAARTISLSFRLFGNMMSGGILMGMVFVGLGSLTINIGGFFGDIFSSFFTFLGFSGIAQWMQSLFSHNFPIVIPVLLYMEEFLVAFIQAMVFSLLVTIFIKVALAEAEFEHA